MNRFLLLFLIVLYVTTASAKSDMKVEGSCHGPNISFTYYSTFDGCRNNSDASVTFTSNQSRDLKGSRILGNGQDNYSFKMMKDGHLKTSYWLVFTDSTGNTEGLFKYLDATGSIKSVILQCDVYDYEYSECESSDI